MQLQEQGVMWKAFSHPQDTVGNGKKKTANKRSEGKKVITALF